MDEGPLVIFGGSAGSLTPLTEVLGHLPEDFAAAIVVALHTSPAGPNRLAAVLGRRTDLRVRNAEDGAALAPEHVHVVPPGNHAIVTQGRRVRLLGVRGARAPRPSIDLLASTAAAVAGPSVVLVVLSGSGRDGVIGAQAVYAAGGRVVVQDPRGARFPSMAESVQEFDDPVASIAPSDIAELLHGVVKQSRPDW